MFFVSLVILLLNVVLQILYISFETLPDRKFQYKLLTVRIDKKSIKIL